MSKSNVKETVVKAPIFEMLGLSNVLENIHDTGMTFSIDQWMAITKSKKNLKDLDDARDAIMQDQKKKFGIESEGKDFTIPPEKMQEFQNALSTELHSDIEISLHQIEVSSLKSSPTKTIRGLDYFFSLMVYEKD